MTYVMDDIAKALRSARERKGLTQRELSEKAGIPQSHISKIESGSVDLRVSSLASLARVLDMELTLVPQKAMAAVETITKPVLNVTAINQARTAEWRNASKKVANAINKLSASSMLAYDFGAINKLLNSMGPIPSVGVDPEVYKSAIRAMKAIDQNTWAAELGTLSSAMQLRNKIAHEGTEDSSPRPAYSIEDDEDE